MLTKVKAKNNVFNAEVLNFEEIEELKDVELKEKNYTSDEINEYYAWLQWRRELKNWESIDFWDFLKKNWFNDLKKEYDKRILQNKNI